MFTKSTSKESKLLLQQVNYFISQIKRNLVLHVESEREYLDYLDWTCLKHSIKSFKIDDKVELVLDYCSHSGVAFFATRSVAKAGIHTFVNLAI